MMLVLLGILLAYHNGAVESRGISGELYSSLTHMNDLFVFDSLVGKMLHLLPTYLPEVNRYKESYASLSLDVADIGKGDVLSVSITGNPLHLFSVIKRLVLYYPAIWQSVVVVINKEYNCTDKHPSCNWWAQWSECEKNPTFMLVNCQQSCGLCGKSELPERVRSLSELQNRTALPSKNDLRGAALALARLQQVYRIPIPDLANGKVENVLTRNRLTTYDCIRIANESHYEGEYANAYLWYNYAIETTNDPETRAHIKAFLDIVVMQHDANYQQNVPQFFPHLLSEYPHQIPWDTHYSRLCRGYNFLKDEELAQLKCYVTSQGSPYLILQPVKYEHLHTDPEMYMFYDVISPREITAIKEAAKDHLQRSLVISSAVPVELRVSQTAWLTNNTHPYLPAIASRISAITGLHVFEGPPEDMGGEQLQVLSYGIGGHYSYHMDVFYKNTPEKQWETYKEKLNHYNSGDRVATWMFYLSDVVSGGRTAFPQAGVSVAPVEGSAVFWFSIKKNGYGNKRSEHGGCPVLLGHKWVANKWIRENVNFLRRPCAVNADE